MNEIAEQIIRERVAASEAAETRLLGFVPCPHPHYASRTTYTFGPRAGTEEFTPLDGPCPECGAAL